MNKAERLNDMMLFLNNKNTFSLSNIMERYSVSKSTALRDIQSLEELGMPLYSTLGRNGHYTILKNRLLSPIIFNIDEVFALYFSMLTLNAYETTPFHLSVEKLKQKFEKCLSDEKIELLRKIEKVFSLGSTIHHNESVFLKDILQFAIEEKVCKVKYRKKDVAQSYIIQFFDISSAFGQWYATGYNFERECMQVFRCDKVFEIEENTQFCPKPFSEFTKHSDTLYKTPDHTDFKAYITKNGIDIFQKESYASMNLVFENEKPVINGFYNKGEDDFIANYLIGYGENILSIEPMELAEKILVNLSKLTNHYQSIKNINQ